MQLLRVRCRLTLSDTYFWCDANIMQAKLHGGPSAPPPDLLPDFASCLVVSKTHSKQAAILPNFSHPISVLPAQPPCSLSGSSLLDPVGLEVGHYSFPGQIGNACVDGTMVGLDVSGMLGACR